MDQTLAKAARAALAAVEGDNWIATAKNTIRENKLPDTPETLRNEKVLAAINAATTAGAQVTDRLPYPGMAQLTFITSELYDELRSTVAVLGSAELPKDNWCHLDYRTDEFAIIMPGNIRITKAVDIPCE